MNSISRSQIPIPYSSNPGIRKSGHSGLTDAVPDVAGDAVPYSSPEYPHLQEQLPEVVDAARRQQENVVSEGPKLQQADTRPVIHGTNPKLANKQTQALGRFSSVLKRTNHWRDVKVLAVRSKSLRADPTIDIQRAEGFDIAGGVSNQMETDEKDVTKVLSHMFPDRGNTRRAYGGSSDRADANSPDFEHVCLVANLVITASGTDATIAGWDSCDQCDACEPNRRKKRSREESK